MKNSTVGKTFIACATSVVLALSLTPAVAFSATDAPALEVGELSISQSEEGTARTIDDMLALGGYAPGEAIVVRDATADTGGKPTGATDLMEADSEVYEQATGDALDSGSSVVIEHVVREGADTAARQRCWQN